MKYRKLATLLLVAYSSAALIAEEWGDIAPKVWTYTKRCGNGVTTCTVTQQREKEKCTKEERDKGNGV